jgi:hypothetical protein
LLFGLEQEGLFMVLLLSMLFAQRFDAFALVSVCLSTDRSYSGYFFRNFGGVPCVSTPAAGRLLSTTQ